MKYRYSILGLVTLLLTASACTPTAQDESEAGLIPEVSSTKVQNVEVVHPETRAFVAEILISATAEANQKVTIYSMENGYVSEIRKNIGDMVQKGEVIAVLENPEIGRYYEEKKAKLDAKKSTYDRIKSIESETPGLTSKQMVENAKAEYLSAKASFNAIEDHLGFLNVKAPFSGKITKRLVDHGALVQSGLTQSNPQPLFEIQEIDPIRLTLPLPESDIASIRKGMDVTISFPELAGADFVAKVSRTAGALDPASKTMQVEIDIANPDGRIKPGMYAKAKLQMTGSENVVSLPITAQAMAQNQVFVWVVENDIVRKIPLRKGLSNKDYFEVLNPEITEESLVITQGKGLVKAGQKVNPIIKSK